MDLSLTDEQQQVVRAFAALYMRESSSDRVRAAEADGFDPKLWYTLRDTGVLEMAVSEEFGGVGATDLDLALVAEQHGRGVAAAPLIEAQVSAQLLEQCARIGSTVAATLLTEVLAGRQLVTYTPRPSRDGRLTVVPAGAIADLVVALIGDALCVVPLEGRRRAVTNLAALPLADVTVESGAREGVTVIAEGDRARSIFSGALDRWLMLTSAALVGIAARSVEIGVEYAKQRHAFGVAIGSFQAVSHPLANSATAVDGARLLAYEAACAFADERGRAGELAAMAFLFGYETARDASHRSLHLHGGYGFGMEQDIQLYYRRARGWAMVYGGPDVVLDRIAALRYDRAVVA
ncbi:acyl-CoA dehydrogenase family protein [Nocardia vaccinii]|uniref:acyl-CoA dehydrogenase family protein n=1 Tax=Nocardia vaccinii TaxID=1822 RepID=UPI00082B7A76|nr:acyl-CoA dehydrogenase family protein [Nocardia vaccinii]